MGMLGGYDAHFYCDCCNEFMEVNGHGIETYVDAIQHAGSIWLLRGDGVVLCDECKELPNPEITVREGGDWSLRKEAQAMPEGFVLVPKDSLKVALSWMNEDIDPWQMGGDSFAELYEHKPILEALIAAQEQSHD